MPDYPPRIRPRLKRPSFPTVISLIALFVALGGTSYAVIKLPAASVGNRELKRDAVTASKIRNGSIGPADLSREAAGRRGPRGPEGPSGPKGEPGAGFAASPGPWQPLPFVGTWSNYGSDHVTAAFRKDQLGKVHLRGLVTKLGEGSETIGTLPPSFRPAVRMMFSVTMCATSSDAGRLDLYPSGDIVRATGQGCEKDFLSLDTVSFWTDG